jgi:hypothetical protein
MSSQRVINPLSVSMRFLFAETCQLHHSETTRHWSLFRVVGYSDKSQGVPKTCLKGRA